MIILIVTLFIPVKCESNQTSDFTSFTDTGFDGILEIKIVDKYKNLYSITLKESVNIVV